MSLRAVVLALLVVTAHAATASAATYTLSLCNDGLCANGVTGPFGTVTTTLNAGSIDVSVTMNAGYALFGSGGAFGFNVIDGVGVTISNVSTGFSAGTTDRQMDGFGTFEYTLNGPVASSALSSLMFTVSKTGGFTLESQLEELSSGVGGVKNTFFAAHVIVTSGAFAGQTGFAGDGAAVPEPGTLLLAASGLVGGAGVWVHRLARRAAARSGGRVRIGGSL